MRIWLSSVVSFAFVFVTACGPADHGGGSNPGADGGGGACPTEGATVCDGNSFQTCTDGEWQVTEQCPILCDSNAGCVECQPGASYCDGEDVVSCDADGNAGGVIETCGGGLHCSLGSCVDLCEEAETNRSYVGCEYWPVDLDNALEVHGKPVFGLCLGEGEERRNNLDVCVDGDMTAGLCDVPGNSCPTGFTCERTPVCILDAKGSPFAIVVSNPNGFAVQVSLETEDGMVQTMPIEPGELRTIYPQQMGVPNRSVDHSGVSTMAYKLTSDAPVVAYQFNPLDNERVFSNDGSLLVPRHAFDVGYYAMTWESLPLRPQHHDYNGYVSVVAWTDGTEVEVTPSANVRAGNGFQAIDAGQTRTFTLDAFEVLNLEAIGTADLTGTYVRATDPARTVGVYAGHEAVAIESRPGDCCADHLEEMMFPTSTWGKEYAIARSQSRGMMEKDVLRIMAQADGTTVTFSPSPTGSCPVLDAGEFCTVDIAVDTVVSANEPILVGHYLKSVIRGGIFDPQGSGDPDLALAVPVEQFRSSYTFLVPQDYNKQFISIVAGVGNNVTLDGTDVTDQLAGFSDAWAGGRIRVQPGQHTLSCTGGCGLEVYGYSDAVSYMFAGGLDLEQIVVE
ncbi:MAG TPA: IgGFc-binding protein [Kofleriaceae bacterium]|nr:IgGFc-binding protein [Kofleriaceae bacterium]